MENQTKPEGAERTDLLQEKNPVAVQNTYSTNPYAESIINVCALVILILGLLAGIVLIVGSINSGRGLAITTLAGFGVIVIALIQWAFLKVLCNISRNLFNINDFIQRNH